MVPFMDGCTIPRGPHHYDSNSTLTQASGGRNPTYLACQMWRIFRKLTNDNGKINELKMYFLLKMWIFQLVMLVFGGVKQLLKLFFVNEFRQYGEDSYMIVLNSCIVMDTYNPIYERVISLNH